MMNKKEAQQQLEKCQEEMKRLEEIINREDNERWRQLMGGVFYTITSRNKIATHAESYCNDDNLLYKTGNYFRTKEEAKQSALYHILNSDYFYWFPWMYSDENKGDMVPDEYEYYKGKDLEWYKGDPDCKKIDIKELTLRWPKNPEVK